MIQLNKNLKDYLNNLIILIIVNLIITCIIAFLFLSFTPYYEILFIKTTTESIAIRFIFLIVNFIVGFGIIPAVQYSFKL